MDSIERRSNSVPEVANKENNQNGRITILPDGKNINDKITHEEECLNIENRTKWKAEPIQIKV